MAKQKRVKSELDDALDGQARRQSGAVRTAWIVGGIALAFFIASLVQGHRGHLNAAWHRLPPATSAAAPGKLSSTLPANRAASRAAATRGNPSPSQP